MELKYTLLNCLWIQSFDHTVSHKLWTQ